MRKNYSIWITLMSLFLVINSAFGQDPKFPATNIQFPTVNPTSMTISWSNGSGNGRLVTMGVYSKATPPTYPADGSTVYTANSIYGKGSDIDPARSGNYVVYKGTGSSVTVTGLSAGVTYYVVVSEYNMIVGISSTIYYYSPPSSEAYATKTTLAVEPITAASGLSVTAVSSTTMSFSWLNGDGASRLVSIRKSTNFYAPPVDGTGYVGSTVFGSGSQIGTGTYVVYKGIGTSLTVTNLEPASTYYIRIHEFNGSGGSANYLTGNYLSGTQATINTPPTIDLPSDKAICENAGTQSINLTGIGTGGESQTLSISASSSNTTVIPSVAVTYKSPDSAGVITFTPKAVGSTVITVTVSDGGPNNSTTSVAFKITILSLPLAASNIDGASTVCQGQKLVVYKTSAITYATDYDWTLPSGAHISSGANTKSVSVNFLTSALSGNVYVVGKNSCGTGISSPAYPVAVNPLPSDAGTISGTATVCQGQTGVAYSVPSIANASGYTWSLPLGATIASGSNTNSITVNFASNASSGSIKVAGTNSCGTGIYSTAFPVTIGALPAASGAISGSGSICEGATAISFSVPFIANATSYEWSFPSGATIVSGGRNITVDFAVGAASGNVTVKAKNLCGYGTISEPFPIVISRLPLAAGTISGTSTLCQGLSDVSYSVAAVTGATSYQWTLPSGAVYDGDSTLAGITVDYSAAAVSGNVIVKAKNSCGFGTPSPSYAVQVDATPTKANAGADQIICSSLATLSANTPTVGTGLWTKVSGSCALNENDNPNTNVSGIATPATIKLKWTISNGTCAPSADTIVITSQTCPLAADFIASASSKCINNSSITFTDGSSGATSYLWNFGDGATPPTANTVGPHTVTYSSSGPKTVSLKVGGIGGSENINTKTNFITINPLPDAAGTIQGTASVCQGQIAINYSVSPVGNSTSYSWTLPSGASINTGSGNSTITVNYSNSAESGSITVNGLNTCGTGASSNAFAVNVKHLPSAAGSITGDATVCQKEKGVQYSVDSVAYATGYNWVLPSGQIVSGDNTKSIVVDFFANANSGNIRVKGTNSCGAGTISPLFALSVDLLPEDAGVVTGAATVCAGQEGVVYSTAPITGADSYVWTLPATGVTIVSGNNTNSITVKFDKNASSGNIRVRGVNACGNGVLSEVFPVTVNPLPVAATAISGTPSVCQGVKSKTYSVSAIDNATSYHWTTPVGTSITSGETTNSIIVDFSNNAMTDNISVYGLNSCGMGDSSNYKVTVNALPNAAGSISGNTSVCQGQTGVEFKVNKVIGASSYIWTVPDGVTIVSGSTTDSIKVNVGLNAISGTISVKGSNTCGKGDSSKVSVSVNPLPDGAGAVVGSSSVAQCVAQKSVLYSVGTINNSTTYEWTLPAGAIVTSGQTNDSITVNYPSGIASGNIIVRGKNACGLGLASSALPVNISKMQAPPICYVTVDTSSKYNRVVWSKPAASDIDSFRVYKKTTNGYEVFATVPFGSLSMVTDYNSIPDVVSSRYKLSSVDTCGNESELSDYHGTILLAANLAVGGGVNLHWTFYEGTTVQYYRILRDDFANGDFQVLDSVASDFQDYKDVNAATFPNSRYIIEAVWNGDCAATNKTLATINTTRSNIKNNRFVTAINPVEKAGYFNVYPNPASDKLYVSYSNGGISTIALYTIYGQLAYSETIVGDDLKVIDLTTYAKGFYTLKVTSGNVIQCRKVVVE